MNGERWHPGEHEAVSCLSKHRYPSGAAAGKAKDAMRRKHRTGPATETLNVYRCQYCDGWHLGRPQKRRKMKYTHGRRQGMGWGESVAN
jgi:hypothetical protein